MPRERSKNCAASPQFFLYRWAKCPRLGDEAMAAMVRNLGCVFTREPDKTAIIDLRVPEAPRSVSYADFDAQCDAVARGLLRRGLKRGDKVGILSLNRTELL